MAASIPQVRPDISDQAGFREIGEEEMSVRTVILKGQILAMRRE